MSTTNLTFYTLLVYILTHTIVHEDMPTTDSKLAEQNLFHALEVEIIGTVPQTLASWRIDTNARNQGLAVALYGSSGLTGTSSFDVLSYIQPPLNLYCSQDVQPSRYSLALINYTGPIDSPHTSWELLSYVDEQESVVTGAENLLQSLQTAMGRTVGKLIQEGEWTVKHGRIPDVARSMKKEGASSQNPCIKEQELENRQDGWSST